ncbi:MAG: hypothetical protein KGS45_05475 [Planctomycetes bacterium]|nr:hypothetical protein [Planctomycetota bacterium]
MLILSTWVLTAPQTSVAHVAHVATHADASYGLGTRIDDTHAKPSLIASTQALTRGSNQLAITFTIDKDWHLYFDGQNDTGQPPKLKLDLPAGVTASPLQFPPPKRQVQGDSILDHIYEETLTLPFTLTIGEDFKGENVLIKGSLEWLECHEECRFGKGSVALSLPVLPPNGKPVPSRQAKKIDEAVKALPEATLPASVTMQWLPEPSNSTLPSQVVISASTAVGMTFVPDSKSVTIANLLVGGRTKRSTMTLNLDGVKSDSVLSGLLSVQEGTESRWYQVSKPVTNPAGPKSVRPHSAPVTTAGGR